jgi:hypothetical protein
MFLKKLSKYAMTQYYQKSGHVKQFWPQRVSAEILKKREHSFLLHDTYNKALNL